MATEDGLIGSLRSELIAQTWTGSSNVVFPTGSVLVVPSLQDGLIAALESGVRTPLAIITPGSVDSDPEADEEPDLLKGIFEVLLAVNVPGGSVGEEALRGANRTGGTTTSEGRGILEIEEEVYNAIGKLNDLEDVVIQIRHKYRQTSSYRTPTLYVAYRVYGFEWWGNAA